MIMVNRIVHPALALIALISLIHALMDLGCRQAGLYTTRESAAYWNGKNEIAEEVSSGTYFYAITAGDFSATGKMAMTK